MSVTLVTGASGFIGRRVAEKLMADTVPLRLLVRRPDALPPELRARAEVVTGDIRDRTTLRIALDGVDTVLHLAAHARAWDRDPQVFTDVNVQAVRALLDEASVCGVRSLVHVSTILTRPAHAPARIRWLRPGPTPYERTKREGERLVERYAAEGHRAVIVHPTRVYGPGPLHDANGATKAIALYLRGRLRLRLADGDALASYVHVDDVAAGIIRAARYGRSGAHYVLGGENISLRGLLEQVASLTGVRRRVVPLPGVAAVALAGAAQLWGRVSGDAPLTPGWVRSLMEDRRADVTAARQDIGYDPRPLRVGLTETIDWLVRSGHVPSPACLSPGPRGG